MQKKRSMRGSLATSHAQAGDVALAHAGFLQKKAHSGIARWQRRYFVLSGHYLSYSQEDTHSEEIKGGIDVADIERVEELTGKPLEIRVLFKSGGVYEVRGVCVCARMCV
jgi:hypothetical protein